MLSASGGLRPSDPLTRGFAPKPPLCNLPSVAEGLDPPLIQSSGEDFSVADMGI